MHTGVSSNLHVPWHDRGQVIKIKFHAYAKLDQGPVSFCYKQGRGKARGGPKNQSAPKCTRGCQATSMYRGMTVAK